MVCLWVTLKSASTFHSFVGSVRNIQAPFNSLQGRNFLAGDLVARTPKNWFSAKPIFSNDFRAGCGVIPPWKWECKAKTIWEQNFDFQPMTEQTIPKFTTPSGKAQSTSRTRWSSTRTMLWLLHLGLSC